MGRLAILAGSGSLPVALAEAVPDAALCAFGPVDPRLSARAAPHRLETLGETLAALRAGGVTEVVLAGSIAPPALDPACLDPLMRTEAPRLMAALAQGDDAALRAVIALIEGQGLAVRGAHEVRPDLVCPPGHVAGPALPPGAEADIARARAILAALGPLDLGQAAVVAGGRCLGIETAQGTEALLAFVAATDPVRRPAVPGVLVKAPKPGQDLRADMPAIGPDTVAQAARAGLGAIAIAAGQSLVLDRATTLAAAGAAGIALTAFAP